MAKTVDGDAHPGTFVRNATGLVRDVSARQCDHFQYSPSGTGDRPRYLAFLDPQRVPRWQYFRRNRPGVRDRRGIRPHVWPAVCGDAAKRRRLCTCEPIAAPRRRGGLVSRAVGKFNVRACVCGHGNRQPGTCTVPVHYRDHVPQQIMDRRRDHDLEPTLDARTFTWCRSHGRRHERTGDAPVDARAECPVHSRAHGLHCLADHYAVHRDERLRVGILTPTPGPYPDKKTPTITSFRPPRPTALLCRRASRGRRLCLRWPLSQL